MNLKNLSDVDLQDYATLTNSRAMRLRAAISVLLDEAESADIEIAACRREANRRLEEGLRKSEK